MNEPTTDGSRSTMEASALNRMYRFGTSESSDMERTR